MDALFKNRSAVTGHEAFFFFNLSDFELRAFVAVVYDQQVYLLYY